MESEFKVTHLYCEGLPPEAARNFLIAPTRDSAASPGKHVALYVRCSSNERDCISRKPPEGSTHESR